MMLHTVNKSPFDKNSLQSCLRLAKPGSAILLIEDGVYGALRDTRIEKIVVQATKDFKLYVLAPDLAARGMSADKLIENIQMVDYGGFVDLALECNTVQAWL